MGEQSDNVTQTTTALPPGFLIPGLTSAANAALGQSGLSGFQGPSLDRPLSRREFRQQRRARRQADRLGIPFTPSGPGISGGFDTNAIIGGAVDTNLQPATDDPAAGLLGQSSDLISRTLGGEFLSPESNPFLQSTFNRAADLTQTRLASEFAGSGRNIGASAPARSDELQTLASNIFGSNFQNERDRQITAVGQASGLDPTNLLIQRLAPLLGSGGTTTSTQPVFQDQTGQILAGLTAGASLFSDRRLKRNIRRIGTVKGYPWYAFNYVWGESAQGVMADEVPSEFVSQRDGFAVVDYGRLLA